MPRGAGRTPAKALNGRGAAGASLTLGSEPSQAFFDQPKRDLQSSLACTQSTACCDAAQLSLSPILLSFSFFLLLPTNSPPLSIFTPLPRSLFAFACYSTLAPKAQSDSR